MEKQEGALTYTHTHTHTHCTLLHLGAVRVRIPSTPVEGGASHSVLVVPQRAVGDAAQVQVEPAHAAVLGPHQQVVPWGGRRGGWGWVGGWGVGVAWPGLAWPGLREVADPWGCATAHWWREPRWHAWAATVAPAAQQKDLCSARQRWWREPRWHAWAATVAPAAQKQKDLCSARQHMCSPESAPSQQGGRLFPHPTGAPRCL